MASARSCGAQGEPPPPPRNAGTPRPPRRWQRSSISDCLRPPPPPPGRQPRSHDNQAGRSLCACAHARWRLRKRKSLRSRPGEGAGGVRNGGRSAPRMRTRKAIWPGGVGTLVCSALGAELTPRCARCSATPRPSGCGLCTAHRSSVWPGEVARNCCGRVASASRSAPRLPAEPGCHCWSRSSGRGPGAAWGRRWGRRGLAPAPVAAVGSRRRLPASVSPTAE
jgi:hypothetical protein